MKNNKEDEVICPCFGITLSDLKEILSKDPSLSFENLQEMTKAGSKCTACTLDVEYFFVKLTDNRPLISIGPKSSRVDTSIKQKMYKFIDKCTPMVSMIKPSYTPIVASKDIETWICIANYSLMYEKKIVGSKMDVELIVRDCVGNVLHKNKYFLDHEEHLRINVSKFLLNSLSFNSAELLIGSLEVKRIPYEVGFRGTTRPQVEIVSKNGNGMVHTQGSLSIKTGGFSCFYRPNDEIVFIAVTNIEKIREINFNIVYPLEKNCDSIKNIVNETIVIPPGGTVFHKINLEGELHEQYFNQPINMKWTVDGLRSTFVLCSSKELDQFSIDHVS